MSQTDYSIADQTGVSFLADLNTTLGAIVSNNSGATQPDNTFAYMWWADTTVGKLKQRNAADSAWINILTLAGIKGSDIANTPAGNVAATDVQAAIDELDADISTNTSDILDRAKLAGGASANFTAMPQVGGDPIVESGSNADGEWTRYADGTQIARFIATTSGATTISVGNLFFTALTSFSFPLPFIATNYLITGGGEDAGDSIIGTLILSNKLIGGIDIAGQGANASASIKIGYLATGRWK